MTPESGPMATKECDSAFPDRKAVLPDEKGGIT